MPHSRLSADRKGFVDHTAYGKTHEYFPIVSKEDYRTFITGKLMGGYFKNSVEEMMSFFVSQKQIDLKEADEILKMIETMKKSEK